MQNCPYVYEIFLRPISLTAAHDHNLCMSDLRSIIPSSIMYFKSHIAGQNRAWKSPSSDLVSKSDLIVLYSQLASKSLATTAIPTNAFSWNLSKDFLETGSSRQPFLSLRVPIYGHVRGIFHRPAAHKLKAWNKRWLPGGGGGGGTPILCSS